MSGQTGSRSALRRFSGDEGGAHTIEFAIFGGLLLIVIMVVAQFGVLFVASQNLDNSLQVATRALLTGSFQRSNAGSADQTKILANLRSLMCGTSAAPAMFYSCANLKVDVQVTSSFASNGAGTSALDSKTGDWASGFGTSYACPSPQSIAVIRAAVRLPLFVPMFKLGFSTFSGNAALLQSASVFRVEPFQAGSSGTC